MIAVARNGIALIRRVFDAFSRRDVEAVVALCDAGIELQLPTAQRANRGEPYRGHEGIRRYFEDVGRVWDELRVVPQEFRELEDGRVFAIGRVYARGGGGLVVDSPAFWLWRIRDGLVVRGQVFEDRRAALKEAGLTGEKDE
jgi:ketosteroid isomerase-like protein